MDLEQIKQLTRELGQGWGHAHAARVEALIGLIGEGLDYDREALAYAAYLHDWGAYPRYAQPGVDHALRSCQVAESEILPATGLSAAAQALAAEAIALHDYRDQRPHTSVESLLLREADWLDMLGVIGALRAFASGPNDLPTCRDLALKRCAAIQGRLTLPRARALAEPRLARMARLWEELEEESLGAL